MIKHQFETDVKSSPNNSYNNKSVFPWIVEFEKESKASPWTSDKLIRLMELFMRKVNTSISKCYHNSLLASLLKNIIRDALILFTYVYRYEKTQEHNYLTYFELLSNLLAVYVDLELIASAREPVSPCLKVAARIVKALCIHLEYSTVHMLNTLIKVKFFNLRHKLHADILNIVISHIIKLLPPHPDTDVNYVRYLLIYRIWRKLNINKCSKKKLYNMAVQSLHAKVPPITILKRLIPQQSQETSIEAQTKFYLIKRFNLRQACIQFSKYYIQNANENAVSIDIDKPKEKLLLPKLSNIDNKPKNHEKLITPKKNISSITKSKNDAIVIDKTDKNLTEVITPRIRPKFSWIKKTICNNNIKQEVTTSTTIDIAKLNEQKDSPRYIVDVQNEINVEPELLSSIPLPLSPQSPKLSSYPQTQNSETPIKNRAILSEQQMIQKGSHAMFIPKQKILLEEEGIQEENDAMFHINELTFDDEQTIQENSNVVLYQNEMKVCDEEATDEGSNAKVFQNKLKFDDKQTTQEECNTMPFQNKPISNGEQVMQEDSCTILVQNQAVLLEDQANQIIRNEMPISNQANIFKGNTNKENGKYGPYLDNTSTKLFQNQITISDEKNDDSGRNQMLCRKQVILPEDRSDTVIQKVGTLNNPALPQDQQKRININAALIQNQVQRYAARVFQASNDATVLQSQQAKLGGKTIDTGCNQTTVSVEKPIQVYEVSHLNNLQLQPKNHQKPENGNTMLIQNQIRECKTCMISAGSNLTVLSNQATLYEKHSIQENSNVLLSQKQVPHLGEKPICAGRNEAIISIEKPIQFCKKTNHLDNLPLQPKDQQKPKISNDTLIQKQTRGYEICMLPADSNLTLIQNQASRIGGEPINVCSNQTRVSVEKSIQVSKKARLLQYGLLPEYQQEKVISNASLIQNQVLKYETQVVPVGSNMTPNQTTFYEGHVTQANSNVMFSQNQVSCLEAKGIDISRNQAIASIEKLIQASENSSYLENLSLQAEDQQNHPNSNASLLQNHVLRYEKHVVSVDNNATLFQNQATLFEKHAFQTNSNIVFSQNQESRFRKKAIDVGRNQLTVSVENPIQICENASHLNNLSLYPKDRQNQANHNISLIQNQARGYETCTNQAGSHTTLIQNPAVLYEAHSIQTNSNVMLSQNQVSQLGGKTIDTGCNKVTVSFEKPIQVCEKASHLNNIPLQPKNQQKPENGNAMLIQNQIQGCKTCMISAGSNLTIFPNQAALYEKHSIQENSNVLLSQKQVPHLGRKPICAGRNEAIVSIEKPIQVCANTSHLNNLPLQSNQVNSNALLIKNQAKLPIEKSRQVGRKARVSKKQKIQPECPLNHVSTNLTLLQNQEMLLERPPIMACSNVDLLQNQVVYFEAKLTKKQTIQQEDHLNQAKSNQNQAVIFEAKAKQVDKNIKLTKKQTIQQKYQLSQDNSNGTVFQNQALQASYNAMLLQNNILLQEKPIQVRGNMKCIKNEVIQPKGQLNQACNEATFFQNQALPYDQMIQECSNTIIYQNQAILFEGQPIQADCKRIFFQNQQIPPNEQLIQASYNEMLLENLVVPSNEQANQESCNAKLFQNQQILSNEKEIQVDCNLMNFQNQITPPVDQAIQEGCNAMIIENQAIPPDEPANEEDRNAIVFGYQPVSPVDQAIQEGCNAKVVENQAIPPDELANKEGRNATVFGYQPVPPVNQTIQKDCDAMVVKRQALMLANYAVLVDNKDIYIQSHVIQAGNNAMLIQNPAVVEELRAILILWENDRQFRKKLKEVVDWKLPPKKRLQHILDYG